MTESPLENLGDARIDPESAELSLPTEVIEWDVVSPGGSAFWAYDPPTDRVVVTQSRRSLQNRGDYTLLDSTDVSEDGTLDLLDELLAEGDERPWTGYLADGDRCYFDSTVDMLGSNLCYLLTADDHQSFWND